MAKRSASEVTKTQEAMMARRTASEVAKTLVAPTVESTPSPAPVQTPVVPSETDIMAIYILPPQGNMARGHVWNARTDSDGILKQWSPHLDQDEEGISRWTTQAISVASAKGWKISVKTMCRLSYVEALRRCATNPQLAADWFAQWSFGFEFVPRGTEVPELEEVSI